MTDRLRELLDPTVIPHDRLKAGLVIRDTDLPDAIAAVPHVGVIAPYFADYRLALVRETIEAICDVEEPSGDYLICRSDAQAIRHYVAQLLAETETP